MDIRSTRADRQRRRLRRGRPVVVPVALAVLIGTLVVPLAAPASAAPPPTPTGLTANLMANGPTRLTWNPSPGATVYEILCEQDPYEDVTSMPHGSVGSVDVRLPTGYNLCSIRAGTGPEWSERAYWTLPAIPAMEPPTGLNATAYSGVVDLYWDNTVDERVTGWSVTSNPPSGEHVLDREQVPGAVAHLAIPGLTQGVAYTFTVTPFREYNVTTPQWGPSSAFNPITLGRTPGAPTVVDVDAEAFPEAGNSALDVWWAPPAETGDSPIDAYRVVLERAEYDPIVVVFTGGDLTFGHKDFEGLLGADIETVSVQARNAAGWGPKGVWAGGGIHFYAKPDGPTNVWARVGTGGTAEVTWDPEPPGWGLHDPPSYEVRIDGPTPERGIAVDRLDYDGETSLAPGWYQARVRARGPAQHSAWSPTRWFAVGAPCDPAFSDVPVGPPAHTFCTPISWMARQGVAVGTAGLFKPVDAVSRQAMASFLYKVKGSPDGPDPQCTSQPFGDVPADSRFCGEIAWLVEQGIADGYADGTFRPTAPVSRQAMASFLFKATSSNRGPGGPVAPPPCDPGGSAAFSDVGPTHVFCPQIRWLADSGVTGGYSDGTFRPTAPVTRQAMAAFLYRWRP